MGGALDDIGTLLPGATPTSAIIAALPAFEQTAVALRLRRDAAYMQLTATAVRQVTVFPYTLEAARATATVEAARFAQQATAEMVQLAQGATAEAVQFAQGATATAVAWEDLCTVQAEARALTATVQAAWARRAELDLARAERLYPLQVYGPWAGVLVGALVLVWGLVRLVRVAEIRARVVKVGAHERELLLLEDRVVQPTRGHVPVINYREPEGAQPARVSAEEQRTTTARAQTVELMRAAHAPPEAGGRQGAGGKEKGGEGRKPKLTMKQAHELMTQQLARAHPEVYGKVRVVPAAQVRTWLDDVRPQAYRDALLSGGEGEP
jgi:hypothetical protein